MVKGECTPINYCIIIYQEYFCSLSLSGILHPTWKWSQLCQILEHVLESWASTSTACLRADSGSVLVWKADGILTTALMWCFLWGELDSDIWTVRQHTQCFLCLWSTMITPPSFARFITWLDHWGGGWVTSAGVVLVWGGLGCEFLEAHLLWDMELCDTGSKVNVEKATDVNWYSCLPLRKESQIKRFAQDWLMFLYFCATILTPVACA